MTYAICNVVCGYQFPDEIESVLSNFDFFEIDNREVSCWDALGLKSFYHDDISPIFCGEVIYRFDECKTINVRGLIPHLTATPEQIVAAKEKMEFTRKALQNFNQIFIDMLKKLGENTEDISLLSQKEINELVELLPKEPEVILIWSKS